MDSRTCRDLVRAAALGIDDLEEAISSVGAESACDLVISELRGRLRLGDLSEFDRDTVVLLQFRASNHAPRRALRVQQGSGDWSLTQDPGSSPEVAAEIAQDLAEILQGLFLPSSASSATRSIQWRDSDDLTTFLSPPPVFHVVQRLCAAMENGDNRNLNALAAHYGSDKWGLHNYATHYQWHFQSMRESPITLVEIGVGGYRDPTDGGASLRMWRDFFPRALVYGLDIVDKSAHNDGRIQTLCADQSAPNSLAQAIAQTGCPDIIIDDGSHISKHVITTFTTLFPLLRPGGKYVIEDLQTSYWPSFGGSEHSTCDPTTSMGMLKDLVDGLNHRQITDANSRSRRETDTQIVGLHFYHNLAIIDKGLNLEPGPPSWLAKTLPESR